ncbi:hypothetical protein KIN20_036793 [Parelaphostrongylus tenuis]|uniref:Uncharacterized protein n=1 Tax=Parelaphostrongylus tenuis TaxID=148309 RepID=A0AAD5WLY1_PARTN|nr:hypothetical protein KIN20_036793 [Parelaphostrongylus tenuis]
MAEHAILRTARQQSASQRRRSTGSSLFIINRQNEDCPLRFHGQHLWKRYMTLRMLDFELFSNLIIVSESD